MNTNITKKATKKQYNSEDMSRLSANDAEKLGNAILGHGNLKKAKKGTGLSDLTIKRAVKGFRVNPDTKHRIKNFLNKI